MTEAIQRQTSRAGLRRALRTATATTALLLLASPQLGAAVKIEHKPVEKSKSGRRVEIDAEIKDRSAGISEARAYFKSGHDTRFWFAPMRPSGKNGYVGILPAPALGAKTVQYRIYAVTGDRDFVKTQLYTIRIEDDEEALARMEAKEPTNVDIDLDQIEEARDLARRGGEPDPSTRVEVRNDVPGSEMPSTLPGFLDYILMAYAPPAAAGAGLGATTAIKASGGGIGAGGVLGTALLLGGVAVAVDEASKEDDDEGDDLSPDQVVQCNDTARAGGDAAERIGVELGTSSGTFELDYQMFSIKDRMVVLYQGSTLFDTGCVSGSARRSISFTGSSTRITVDVTPNCEGGTTGTQWEFTVFCP